MIIMVSACLVGICSRYDGHCQMNERALGLTKGHTVVPFCPEQMGGLSTPRPKATLCASAENIIKKAGHVINENNEDVTGQFISGAMNTIMLASICRPGLIILKENSPSCGFGNTNIMWQRKGGMGIAACLLFSKGFEIISF